MYLDKPSNHLLHIILYKNLTLNIGISGIELELLKSFWFDSTQQLNLKIVEYHRGVYLVLYYSLFT